MAADPALRGRQLDPAGPDVADLDPERAARPEEHRRLAARLDRRRLGAEPVRELEDPVVDDRGILLDEPRRAVGEVGHVSRS